MNKYDRTNFLDKNFINGKPEYDLGDCHFNLLNITRPIYQYSCNYDDIGRPDLISLRIYKDIQFWWIILKYNNISDPWNELYATKTLYAPNEQDIQDWYLKVQKLKK